MVYDKVELTMNNIEKAFEKWVEDCKAGFNVVRS